MNRLANATQQVGITDLIDQSTLDWKCSTYFRDVKDVVTGIIGDQFAVVCLYRGAARYKDRFILRAIYGYMFPTNAAEYNASVHKKCGLCLEVISDLGMMLCTGEIICCGCVKKIKSVEVFIERSYDDRCKWIFATYGDDMLMIKCVSSQTVSNVYFSKKCIDLDLKRCHKVILNNKHDGIVSVCTFCMHMCKGGRNCDKCLDLITGYFIDKYVFRYWAVIKLHLIPELRDIIVSMVIKT